MDATAGTGREAKGEATGEQCGPLMNPSGGTTGTRGIPPPRPSRFSRLFNWNLFARSPKIVVWSAVEEVARLQKSTARITVTDRRNRKKSKEEDPRRDEKQPGFVLLLVTGLLFGLIGIATIIWKPFDIMMNERLKMIPGFPAYDWWKDPPDAVLLRMYVFNVTNSKEFSEGREKKLNVKEIGPYIFREKLRHTDVRFNDNGTLTYVAHREAIFLPEMNTLSLNESIIVPNLAVLGIPSYLWNAPLVAKLGLNFILRQRDAQPFAHTTVFNYMWNFTDPLLGLARSLAPHLVPEENMGVLHQIYKDFVDEITVHMGTENGWRKFFTLEKFRGRNGLGAWENETCDSVQGSTEGVCYHQGINRNDTLRYLRKTICRVALLYYARDVEMMGMKAYRFELANDTFSRPAPDSGQKECFHNKGLPLLPSGITDVSPCYYDFPIASSFPHFLHSDPAVTEKISGLEPDPDKHGSFVVVEPTTGVPFRSSARSQSSLIVRPMNGFPMLKRFSNMAIPMFWAEYSQESLPWYVAWLTYFTVMILPSTQLYFSCFLVVVSSVCLTIAIRRIRNRRQLKPRGVYSTLDIPRANDALTQC